MNPRPDTRNAAEVGYDTLARETVSATVQRHLMECDDANLPRWSLLPEGMQVRAHRTYDEETGTFECPNCWGEGSPDGYRECSAYDCHGSGSVSLAYVLACEEDTRRRKAEREPIAPDSLVGSLVLGMTEMMRRTA